MGSLVPKHLQDSETVSEQPHPRAAGELSIDTGLMQVFGDTGLMQVFGDT